ncbi:hypothetical protein KAR91_07785 [Candidatus Pacearchaeota archaeon]|nr:hypothetical protein [Candidatus Pacearchaeota archaeon]
MDNRQWSVIYKDGYVYLASSLMTKEQAMSYMNIFGDAVAIQKVRGWFKRFIEKKPKN